MDIVRIKPIHQIVARELAKGSALKDICEAYDLNYDTWLQISNAPLFKHQVDRILQEISAADIEDHVEDPVRKRILELRGKAVEQLSEEVNAYEEHEIIEGRVIPKIGASSATRIKAAHEILDAAGDFKKEERQTNTVIINLSRSVLDRVLGTAPLKDQPINITQEALAS